ncbi:hypothetical protein GCM10027271_04970 [Saccharopolyspora gloriosae]
MNGPFVQSDWASGPFTSSDTRHGVDAWFRVNGPFVQSDWASGPFTSIGSRRPGEGGPGAGERTVRPVGLGERSVHSPAVGVVAGRDGVGERPATGRSGAVSGRCRNGPGFGDRWIPVSCQKSQVSSR